MAKKKKNEIEAGRTIWHINEDGSVTPLIQNQEDIAPVKEQKSTWFKKGTLDDSGYAIENPIDAINRINAGILMTGVDALGQFGKGFLGSAEGVTDLAKTTTADVLDFFGADNKARKLRESAEKTWGVNEQLEQALASDNGTGIDDMSFLGEKGKTVPQGLGTTMFSMTTGGLGGALLGTTAGASATSMALLGMSAAGNSEQEAIKEMKANQKINGLSDKEIYKNAKLYGVLSGIIETGTEMMFGAAAQGSNLLGIGTGAFDEADDAVINALTKKISNKMIKTFTQAGLKATSEGVEEVASGFLNAWAKKLTYMKQEDIKKLIEDENLLDSFLSGTFSAALSQAPSVVNNITTTENGKLRLRNNNEIRDFITNLNEQEQQVVEREIENRLEQEEKVTKKRRSEIEKQVIEDLDRGYINANTIRDVLGENYNAERDVRLNESFNEETRRTQAYENDLSKYDEKQRATIQRAIDSGLFNNTNKTHDLVDLIAKISADKGVDFDFTNNQRIKESGFAIDGKQVNGFIKDGKIALNLESNQVLNKTVGHEITHVLEGTDLYNSLQDSLKSFIGEREWNNRISQLEKDYKNVKGANIENELTSDLVGEYVFNDESFVKSLSTKNPNLFQKIFDEIKYMVKIATAGSKEARDLEKVKRAFEKAYRETSKEQQGTQYSLEQNYRGSHQIEDGTSIVNLDLNNIRNQIEEIDGYITRETEKDFNKLKKILNNPEGNVKIYRAAPVGELNNGDWVTTDKSYAKNVANNNGGKVYEYEVKANELNYPSNIKELPSLHRLSSFQYTGENQQNVKYSLTNNEVDNTSFSLEQRVSGDKLLDAQDLIEEVKDVGAEVDENGYVTVYHQTSNENAQKIRETGEMLSNEPYVYFSTSREAQQSQGRGETKLEFKIPAENLILDDLFSDNADVKVALNGNKTLDISNYLVNNDTKYSLTTDNQGRQLSEQQQEYFKDSKVRDENGNLLTMYHGTLHGGFTVFERKNRPNMPGGYFSNSTDYTNTFAGIKNGDYYDSLKEGIEKGVYKPQTYEVYLDVKNPLILPMEQQDTIEDIGYWDYIYNDVKNQGYDGVMLEDMSQVFVFNPNQIKSVDNTNPTSNPDIRYSLSVEEANTTQDNEGRKLNENQLAYFKDSKAVDENGNLVTVYHTMTNTGNQFFEFNPVGTDFYRFGEQVVNYFTNNQDMSGSYADSNYKKAYTKPIKTIEDAQDFITYQNTQSDGNIGVNGITNHYEIEKDGDGYKLIQKPSGKEFLNFPINSEETKVALDRVRANEALHREFVNSNDPVATIKNQLESWYNTRQYDGYPQLAELIDIYNRETTKLVGEKTTQREQSILQTIFENDLEEFLFGEKQYSDENISGVIDRELTKKFANEQELIDNIQNEFKAKYQYAGYINMTNPYVIDTFGENWDSVTTERNEAKNSEYNRVVKDNETKEKLYNLAQESERLFKEYSQSNKPREFAEYSIIKNKINNSELREVVNDMGMFGLTYEGWLEAGKKNAELFGEEYKQTLPNSDEKISNYTESLNPAELELVQDLTIGEFVNRYGELYKENMKFGDSSSYFKDQFRTTTGTNLDTDKIGYSNMFDLARYNFDGSSVSEFLDEKLTTNDLVKRIIEKNNSGETNYDGLIMKNVYDYGGQSNKSYRTTGDLYVTFNSNQFKAVDNLNPTNDADIRYQLGNNEVAPTSGWNVRSEDVRLQSAFKDTIAPLQEQVQQLTDTINRLEDRIAPLNEQEADELYQETQKGFENEVAPIRENLTPEENQRMDMLELLERNGMLTDERRYEKEQLENKVNPVYPTEESTPGQALSDIRDMDEIGKRDVKAYQFEHPEVKPYFQEEARGMLNDLNNSIKGERFINESQQRGQGTSYDVTGVKRFTSPEIAELLDSKYGYTYDDIRKGLNAIIEDHGAENIAIAKRIELVLDDNLRNGYTDWQTGTEIPPNQQYLNMLAEQEWQNYFDDINSQYPLEQLQEPQYNLEDEETDFSDVSIEPDLSNFTADDIDVSPFLEGLQGTSKRQAERQQQREELNQKKEVKIPKQSDGKRALNRGLGLLVNEFAVLDDYSKQTGNKDIKFKTDTYNNYQAIAQSNIETAQTDINGKAIGRSGNSIFEEAKNLGLENTFDEYLKQWANVDRAKQGKGAANYSAKESYKIVKEMEAKHPALKRLGKDMWQYYRNARHNLRDAGIINQDVSDMLGRMYPHYTPYISENIENYFTDEGKLKPKATIKRAKGGAAIGSLLSAEEAMQRYTKSEFNTIFGNDLFREIVNTSNDIVQLGGDDRGMQFVNADNLYADKDGYYLTAYENGEPITARISEDMYRTLSRESRNRISDIENTFSAVTKPLQAASKLRRNILTSWSPTFIAKNFIKDFQEGIFNSKYTKDFIKNYPSAFKELSSNTELAQQFKSLYGSGLTMGQYDIDANNYNPSGKNRNFLKGIKNVNELIELAPRFAEFKASIDHGASLQEAMYNAREVTTNFSRGGTLAKALNRNGFTFLNSSIQGFDKFIRNFSGENGAKGIVNSLAKAAIFGIAPAVFNELAFGSGDDKDEEYEALPDYIKDNYYIIKTGDGNFIRIPKGRVLSVFGSAARRTIEAMEGEENAFEGYWNNVQQQIGINNPEENNIFAPLIQAMGGRKLDSGQTAGSAWYGGDIIPSRLQKERPEDQYDASIDKLSIWLGQRTGISPYKINYVLDQYSGGIGDIFLPTITPEANSDGNIIAPIKDQFTADTVTDNKYVSEFYDTYNKIYTGSKKTDEDILKKNYMSNISFQMSDLYKERREVQADENLTKQQKYAKSQEIKAEINRLAKEGMDNYNDIIMSNNYAKIGDTEYYKNANGQWTKVTDDVASLGLDTEEKSEYYKVKNDIYTTKKNNDGNDKPLVVQDIINSNLTPDAKVNLYTSNYKDDLIQPLVDSGMDVDSYLTFKSQNFTADKDSNGKSISGSKKQKVFDYINSMDVPYEQKLLLAKSEYNSFNDNNYEIIEYIENTGMDYDERIELYKALGFKVDGDSISW